MNKQTDERPTTRTSVRKIMNKQATVYKVLNQQYEAIKKKVKDAPENYISHTPSIILKGWQVETYVELYGAQRLFKRLAVEFR